MLFHILLHRVGNVGDPIALPRHFEPLKEALASDLDQVHGRVAHIAAGEGGAAVAVEALQIGAHVHADDIALHQLPVVRNAVDDHIVDGDTGGAGIAPIIQEGGLCPVGTDKVPDGVVNLQGGDTRFDHGAGQRTGLGRQGAGPAHQLDLAGGF